MTYCQDLDTAEVVQLPRPDASRWCATLLARGGSPYLSETPIPRSNALRFLKDKPPAAADEWSVDADEWAV